MPSAPAGPVFGLVLAAGAGRRFGGPKALARTPAGTPWLALAVRALRDGGCAEVVVVLGAGAEEARGLVPEGATAVTASGWESGVAASLRTGVTALESSGAVAAVVVPVDTPDLPVAAVARIVRRAGADALVQATYAGAPGHPVLLGRAHWSPLAASVRGDVGARPYLIAQGAESVECSDLWTGVDRDTR